MSVLSQVNERIVKYWTRYVVTKCHCLSQDKEDIQQDFWENAILLRQKWNKDRGASFSSLLWLHLQHRAYNKISSQMRRSKIMMEYKDQCIDDHTQNEGRASILHETISNNLSGKPKLIWEHLTNPPPLWANEQVRVTNRMQAEYLGMNVGDYVRGLRKIKKVVELSMQ